MATYDEHYNSLVLLAQKQSAQNRNEAQTRLEIINHLFHDCLGWEEQDVKVENEYEGEYADYVYYINHACLVVEAKREGISFEMPIGKGSIERSLKTLCSDKAIKNACKQAMGYANERGVQFTVVSNGHQIIAFLASRNDGIKPLDATAAVFYSLEHMLANFHYLWNILSKPGVQECNLRKVLLKEQTSTLPSTLAARINNYPGTKHRNTAQVQLKIISDLVLEELISAPIREEEFLTRCYCQNDTLSQYSLETRNILKARYSHVNTEDLPGPDIQPAVTKRGNPKIDLLAEGIGRSPILLIGDIGAGKTTFIRNLITVVAKDFFANAIPLHLDLGSKLALAKKEDIKDDVILNITQLLKEKHGININNYDFLTHVYRDDMAEWEEGIAVTLKGVDDQQYASERYSFLKELQSNTREHLKRSIIHISLNQNKPVVLFLDNLDQRTIEVQEQAFLIAHEIANNWQATVFLTIRPETFHASRQSNVLGAYHPRAFTISPPRVELVIRKRLSYALELVKSPIAMGITGQTIEIGVLTNILKAIVYTIDTSRDIISCLDNITAGNIRLALDFVRDFLSCGHVNTSKISSKIEMQGCYLISLHELLRAIIYGDHVYFDPKRAAGIANIFYVTSSDPKEHFLVPYIIMLMLRSRHASEIKHGFMPEKLLYSQLQDCGFLADQIEQALFRMSEKRLIQSSHHKEESVPQSYRPTSNGLYHALKLPAMFAYTDAMIVDTPILTKEYYDQIATCDDVLDRARRARVFREYLDRQWAASGLTNTVYEWSRISNELKQDIDLSESKALIGRRYQR